MEELVRLFLSAVQSCHFRDSHLWIVYLLPVGGLMIVGLYKLMKVDKDKGTNLVLTSISGKDELPFKMAPLIF